MKIIGDKVTDTAQEIIKNGIHGRMGKKYTKEDGLAFLEEMRFAFSCSRFRASEVYDSGNGERNEKEKT